MTASVVSFTNTSTPPDLPGCILGTYTVDRTWRTRDRQWLIDEVVDEPGVAYRIWDAEGAPVAEVPGPDALGRLLTAMGIDQRDLESVPVQDEWCE